MDVFKRTNIKLATSWDWNVPQIVKRKKGDTAKLHRYSRRKLKQKLKEGKEDNYERFYK